jgi:hypothetical protein
MLLCKHETGPPSVLQDALTPYTFPAQRACKCLTRDISLICLPAIRADDAAMSITSPHPSMFAHSYFAHSYFAHSYFGHRPIASAQIVSLAELIGPMADWLRRHIPNVLQGQGNDGRRFWQVVRLSQPDRGAECTLTKPRRPDACRREVDAENFACGQQQSATADGKPWGAQTSQKSHLRSAIGEVVTADST